MPVTLHEKSSRNCHFVCSVACGVFGLAPIATVLGNSSYGSELLSPIPFAKFAYWKMNSFSRDPPSTQLWFALIELNVFVLVLQELGTNRRPAPYGCVFVFRP